MKHIYPAIFSKNTDKPSYSVIVPDLPGCAANGDSLLEAIENTEDAALGWLLDVLEAGQFPPPSSELSDFELAPDQFCSLLVLDIDSYAEKFGANAVRKNLTIPAWLNAFALAREINFSAVLTDALHQIYCEEFEREQAKHNDFKHSTQSESEGKE
ncbi:MAG: type II toxin-antitoxin system HicB family antitoxin [Firmicutes bacterium]|nr:type II toxin-antitoxin system HicB family antitoxin [Bacillota bacterium]